MHYKTQFCNSKHCHLLHLNNIVVFFLLQYENGEKEVRLFSDTEYEGRLAKLRSEVKYYRSGGLLQYFFAGQEEYGRERGGGLCVHLHP